MELSVKKNKPIYLPTPIFTIFFKITITNQVYNFSVLVSTSELKWETHQPALTKAFLKLCERFVYQLEIGTKKKKWHFQCFLKLKTKLRPKRLAKLLSSELGMSVRASPASTAGTESLKQYCMKKETRQAGPWADRKVYMGGDLPATLRPWQVTVREIFKTAPHKRRIYWYYDSAGGRGKSTLAKYLYFHDNILTLTFGNAGDLLNLVSKLPPSEGYIFDLSRTKGGQSSMSDIYQAIESVKNGYFINTKYNTEVACFDIPHVVVFSNHKPDTSALSKDRWRIIDMSQMSQGII